MAKEDDTPDTQIQNRFRGLINELDPDDGNCDSDDSSILDYLEWERILDPVPSHSQLVSRGPSKFSKNYVDKESTTSSECNAVSCDESRDQSHDQTLPDVEEVELEVKSNGGDLCGSHVTSSSESHDHSWDIAPLGMSGPAQPNENGLILVHVSEVYMCMHTCTLYIHTYTCTCAHTHTHAHSHRPELYHPYIFLKIVYLIGSASQSSGGGGEGDP